MRKANLLLVSVLIPQFVFGAEILVRPSQAGRSSDVIAYSDMASSYTRPGTSFQVRMNLSCFGTNLRMVENPISPFAAVKFDMALQSGTSFSVIFPGWLTMNDRLQIADQLPNPLNPASRLKTFLGTTPDVFEAKAVKNTIIFDVPDYAPSGANFDAAGNLTNLDMYSRGVTSIAFAQDQTSAYGIVPVMNDFDRKEKSKPWAIEKVFASIMTPLKWLPWGSEKTFAGGTPPCCAPTDGGGGGDGGAPPPPAPAPPPPQPPPSFGLDTTSTDPDRDAGWWQPHSWGTVTLPPTDPEALKYIGQDGPISGHWEYSWSSDFKTLNVNATFPGQEGFCGGYFSPLMLFFEPEVPKFNYTTQFKMSSLTEYTAWPEPNATADFLVLDRNKDGVINDISEMFGSEDDSTNGFEILKVYDENEDGRIDARDPVFSELRLWKDSTGSGKTLKKDLRTLKQAGVQSISLNYDSSRFAAAGLQAELRQRATFVFVKNGKKTQGEVIDVWFKGSN